MAPGEAAEMWSTGSVDPWEGRPWVHPAPLEAPIHRGPPREAFGVHLSALQNHLQQRAQQQTQMHL